MSQPFPLDPFFSGNYARRSGRQFSHVRAVRLAILVWA
jgi:hypothetical protein